MSLETRSNSALMKRAEQLKRWQDSETFREPGEPRSKNRRIVVFSASLDISWITVVMWPG